MKSINLTALILLALFHVQNASAAMSCAEVLGGEKPWYAAITRKFDRAANFVHSFEKLQATDPRLAGLKLVKYSQTLDRVDNFSTPALMTNGVLLSNTFQPQTKEAFQKVREAESVLSLGMLSAGAKLSDAQIKILDHIESRFRLAAFALHLSTINQPNSMFLRNSIRETYYDELVAYAGEVLADFSGKKTTKKLFSDETQNLIDGSLADYLRATSKPVDEIFATTLAAENLSSSFRESVALNQSLSQNLKTSGDYLSEVLAELPVGISLRPTEAVSTVRFGNTHYYGNYYMYKNTSRRAYERGKTGIVGATAPIIPAQGIMDAEFNVPNRKKKVVAVLLDQTHQNLDPVEGLGQVPRRCIHNCGSYPNYLLLRSGVPVISPVYVWAEPGMLSFALQKIVGLPTIKKFRMTKVKPLGLLTGVPVFYMHGITGGKLELTLYLWIVSKATGTAWLANLLW